MKGATKFTETNGTETMIYACLNGRYTAFYVGEHGNIGNWSYPVGGIFGGRPPGIVDPTFGRPSSSNIGTDGKILPVNNPPTYGILSALYDTGLYYSNTQTSILEKREVVTTFSGSVIASWGIWSSHADLQGVIGTDGMPGTLSVSGSDATGPMSVTTSVRFVDSNLDDLLDVIHTYSIQNDSSHLEMFRIKVEVTISPLQPGAVSDLFYGYTLASHGASTSTRAGFFSATDPEAFASSNTRADWNADLGVYEGVGEGTRIGYLNSTIEYVIARNFNDIQNNTHSILLGSGTNAEFYTNNVLQSSTTNFKTDLTWRNSLPDDISGYSSYLVAPEFDISSGDPQTYTFYIFVRLIDVATASPKVWAYVG
jgi:hypothetical protein